MRPESSSADVPRAIDRDAETARSFPAVESVLRNARRALTATDPVPLERFETVINIKPEEQWRDALGLWGTVTFVVCVLFGLLTPQSLHMHVFLELILPGFKWLPWRAILLGLTESFLYGVCATIVILSDLQLAGEALRRCEMTRIVEILDQPSAWILADALFKDHCFSAHAVIVDIDD